MAKKNKTNKPAKQQPQPVAETVAQPAPAAPEPKPAKQPKPKKAKAAKPEPEAKPAKPEPKPKAKKGEGKVAKDKGDIELKAADFMLFVGGNYYPTKEVFINEANVMGISRRMPTHRLPADLVCGQSKVFVAFGGHRVSGQDDTQAEVFGYFTPTAIEFLAMGKGKMYADIVGALKARPDAKIIDTIKGELERGCGYRKEGGTYLVVDKADSPLVLFNKPAPFTGNHFRGMMRLTDKQSASFIDGTGVSVLVDEHCMNCGGKMKCSPDGHARADRERRRIDKGENPKWYLLDDRCRKAKAKERAAERKAAKELDMPAPQPEVVDA